MKRIIRLTESDLARIVRRVINEGTETTTMTPISTEKLNLAGATMMIQAPNDSFVTFNLTPKKVGDKLQITFSTTPFLALGGMLEYDCTKKIFTSASSHTNADKLKNYKVMFKGYEKESADGQEAAKLFKQGMDFNMESTKGQTGELITKYCTAK